MPWTPAQELVALLVALVFDLDVLLKLSGPAELSTMTEWSMTRSTGTCGLMASAGRQASWRVAHGGKVDHGGNAGEVLHQHAGRAVGDLVSSLPLLSSHA